MFKPNREFQAGLNADDSRRRRQNQSLSLRKKDRENKLEKKRQRILESSSAPNNNQSMMINGQTGDHMPVERVPCIEQLPKLVEGVYHSSIATQFECVKAIRIVLSQPDKPPIQQVIDSGVIPRLIQLSRDCTHPALQYESLWALLNIASGPAECTAHIIRNNSHNVFIDLLKTSKFYEIREQSMWALGNISGDGKELKNLLLKNGILANILFICQSRFDAQFVTNFNNVGYVNKAPLLQFLGLLNTTSWTLSNLCRASPPPTLQHLELILQCLMCLMKQCQHYKPIIDSMNSETIHSHAKDLNVSGIKNYNDRFASNIHEIFGHIAWAASYLIAFEYDEKKLGYDGIEHLIRRMGEDGLLEQFVNLMDYCNAHVRHSCNRVIGIILTGSDENTKKCLNLGILQKYYNVLKFYNNSNELRHGWNNREKKEVCWALSNITAGPIDDRLMLLRHKLYPILISYLETAPYEVGKEALWALSNATADQDKRIIAPLFTFGIVNALCSFLKRRQTALNSKILMVALECIENILTVGQQPLVQGEFANAFEEEGFPEFLEDLQADETTAEDIYEKAVEIIKKFFNGQYEDDHVMAQDAKADEIDANSDVDHAVRQNGLNGSNNHSNNDNNDSNNNNNNSGQFGFGLLSNGNATFGF